MTASERAYLRVVPAEPGYGSYRTERERARRWRMTAIVSMVANAIIGFAVTAYVVGSHAWY